MVHQMTVRTPDELVAVVPHLLGFRPQDSIVLMPVRPGLPVARIDLPHTADDRDKMLDAIVKPYASHAQIGAQVALVSYSDDPADADLASARLAGALEDAGIDTTTRIWANDKRWVDLDDGATGLRTPEAANRIAAETVMAGMPRPADSRESLAEPLIGDREPVGQALPDVRDAARYNDPTSERDWALGRIGEFHANGNRLNDADAARMLVGIESTKVRDGLWEDMSRENAHSHVALWSDLTARAPDDVRTPAATMLAFSSWLDGNGAKAWSALGQIPQGQSSYPMAQLVAGALQQGINPNQWDQIKAASPLAETSEPPSRGQRHERNIDPGQSRPGPAGPAR